MDWQTPFVVYRFKQEEGATEVFEVYHASDFKDAKRWVSYIGLPWDVLCKTPLHPKHSKASPAPEYFAHKVQA
jgi:hypothetical protein